MPRARAAICVEACAPRATKPGREEQVLGRVAGDRELGEEDEVGAGLLRLAEPAEDPLAVPVEVADGGVDLGAARAASGFSLSGENSAAEPDRVQSSLSISSAPATQLVDVVVLGVDVAAGERVRPTRGEDADEPRRELGRRPRRVVAEDARSAPSCTRPGADEEDGDPVRWSCVRERLAEAADRRLARRVRGAAALRAGTPRRCRRSRSGRARARASPGSTVAVTGRRRGR